jgi:hypothetical protein
MDLKVRAEECKTEFWQFLLEQSLNDSQFPVFEKCGGFCVKVDQSNARFDKAMTELDDSAEQAIVEMESVIDSWNAGSLARMDEEGDGDGDDWPPIKPQEQGNPTDDTHPDDDAPEALTDE